MTHKTIFYVYEHWRPDTDVCFYVGKGSGRRANKMTSRSQRHERIQKKLNRMGMCVEVRMVSEGLTEDAAYAFERDRIAFWRSIDVHLINHIEGGRGVKSPDQATRQKMSRSSKKKWEDPAFVERWHERLMEGLKKNNVSERVSTKMRGRTLSDEHRRKISVGNTGVKKVPDPWLGEKNHFFGKKHTPESLAKISAKKKGSKLSEETKARMREAQSLRREREKSLKPPKVIVVKERKSLIGRRHTPEAIERMKIAAKLRGISEVTRAAQKAKCTGRKRGPFSDDTIAKMRVAASIRQEARRVARINGQLPIDKRSKPVVCLSDGKVFPTARAAAEFYGINRQSIAAVCLKRRGRKTVGGHLFSFTEA